MALFRDLQAIIGNPTKTPPLVDWGQLYNETGLLFPEDYREWVETYTDIVLDGTLAIKHPGILYGMPARDSAIALLSPVKEMTDNFSTISIIDDNEVTREASKYAYYPEPGGLYPWGASDNGDYCFWKTHPNPDKWIIVITDVESWWSYSGSFTDFMVGVLSGNLYCPIFAEGFPRKPGPLRVQEFDQSDLDSQGAW
jgi:hypothetical protein